MELVELLRASRRDLRDAARRSSPNAIRAYRRIFDELDKAPRGGHRGAGAHLRAFQEAWQELDAVYQRELENASGDAAEADIRAKIAQLAAERLGQPERAIETWRVVLDLRGEDPEALHALANLYESLEQWAKLVDILEREFDIAANDDDRVNILTRRARVTSEKLGRDDSALEDWNRVLDIDYANLAALRAIAASAPAPGRSERARRRAPPARRSRGAAPRAGRAEGDLPRARQDVRRAARSSPYDAADAWRKLLEVGPDFEAMDALEAIYRAEENVDRRHRREDAAGGRARRPGRAELPSYARSLRSGATRWETRTVRAKASKRSSRSTLRNDEAFAELEKLHTAAGRWEPLIELYLARLDRREETSEKTELLRKIARVFEEKLDDKDQALDALVNALEMDFHDRETARYLERMAQATGRWTEVIQTVNGWLKHQTEANDKIRLCLHLAKWYGDDLGHPEYAQPYYAQIIQLDPHNVGAMRQLASLYKKAGNWQQMGSTLTRALDVATNDIDRKEILNDLGELLESQLQKPEQAIAHFQRALEVDSNFLPALENLERIYTARGQNRELVDVLQRKVPALRDSADIAATKLRIAQLYETTSAISRRRRRSIARWSRSSRPTCAPSEGLLACTRRSTQWPELVAVLERQLDVVTTERERIDVLMQLATLHEEHFLKADLAARRLEQVLEIDPNNEDAYFKLERNYRKLRQWLELVNTYDRHIAATLDRKTKVELFGAIAQVYADEVEDAERAIDAYKNIVDLDDENVPALEALSKLYDKLGDGGHAIDFMTRVAELTQDTKQRVEAFYRIGKALDERVA